MIRSLFAGVTGMKNHQIRMDVIGNNIANINTVGFKRGQVNFQDTLYQVLKNAGVSTNPVQVGLGVAVSSIINNMNPGALQFTGRTLDLAINGDGFFKVKDPMSDKYFYTRDGVFYIDQNGYLVNADGYRLVGTFKYCTAARSAEAYSQVSADELQVTKASAGTGDGSKTSFYFDFSNAIKDSVKIYVNGAQVTDCTVDFANNSINFSTPPAADAAITVDYQKAAASLNLQGTRADGTAGESKEFTINATQKASISAGGGYNLGAGAVIKLSDLGFTEGDAIEFTVKNAYTGENKSFKVRVGTTADLANGIVDKNSTLANLKTALANVAPDYAQGVKMVDMYYTKNGFEVGAGSLDGTGDNEGFGFRTAGGGPGIALAVAVTDSTGSAKSLFNKANSEFVNGFASEAGSGDDVNAIVNKINAEMASVGVKASRDSATEPKPYRLVIRTTNTEAGAKLTVGGDAAGLIGLTAGVYQNDEEKENECLRIDGEAANLNIGIDGVITGLNKEGYLLEWESGAVDDADFAQINLFTFRNQDGLERVNKNLFKETESSGEPSKPGKPGATGYGTIASGYLEMSNVDLTDEFTNMITTQRGYQASARMITVSDTMLEELLNLKR